MMAAGLERGAEVKGTRAAKVVKAAPGKVATAVGAEVLELERLPVGRALQGKAATLGRVATPGRVGSRGRADGAPAARSSILGRGH
jgi:hypothetical protein